MISVKTLSFVLAASQLHLTSAIDLDVNDAASIKAAARILAYGVQSYYNANATGAPETSVGTFPPPAYWWEGGAIWGGKIDYWAYTDDSSWNEVTTQGLVAQSNAPAYDYMPPAFYSSLGNDDQAFWAIAALSALEYGYPTPQGQPSTFWLDVTKNVYNSQTPRWETSTCGGGLRWQIFESNKGYTYKNSISSGALFQIAARLARYSGEQDYVDWAEKIWDWMTGVGLITSDYSVFDGVDMDNNCTTFNHLQWSYNPAILLYGTAMLANSTNDQVWRDRSDGLLTGIKRDFFSPYGNATNIMYEVACETIGTCNYDQQSFKAYLSRWMAKAAIVYPSIKSDVSEHLVASAQAAAKACTGGATGQACGQAWYTGGFDGRPGLGQELSGLETIQALLLLNGDAARIQPISLQKFEMQAAPEPASTYETVASSITPAPEPQPAPQTQQSTPTSMYSSVPSEAPMTSSTSSTSSSSSAAPPPAPTKTTSSRTTSNIVVTASSTPQPTPETSTYISTTSTKLAESTTTSRPTVSVSVETSSTFATSSTPEPSSTTESSAESVTENPTTPIAITTPAPTSSSTAAGQRAQPTGALSANFAAAGVFVAAAIYDGIYAF